MNISHQSLVQLEWFKLLDHVLQYCKSPHSRDLFLREGFETDRDRLAFRLQILGELIDMIKQQDNQDFISYEDINEDLFYLEKENYVLDVQAVLRIRNVVFNYNCFDSHFNRERKQKYASYYSLFSIPDYSTRVLEEINKVFNDEGEVRPNASKELLEIHRKIENTARQVDRQFTACFEKYKNMGLLSEQGESWRNGRRVLVLATENKRRVNGVLHDQSGSGKTIFVEPEELVRLNNELASLENEKRLEVYRILRKLSESLRREIESIQLQYSHVVSMDMYRARAKFSISIRGNCPEIFAGPCLQMKNAVHPLLFIHNLKENKKTISFDLQLHGANHLLLISGPNAGGKSVTLKAVGLLHLMLYFGLYVPLDSSSKLGIFDAVFTDIGDQQSIDEGLSTYSSHLSNLRHILEMSTGNSLVLLDEIGSGTDPKLGGAIAEGILESLRTRGAYGVVTTHYSSLKIYAFHNPGIVNGAMLFDKDNLAPSYVLKVGKPGSSYAFEVANKVGLDKTVLNYARKKTGKNQNELEDLLIDLQEGKAILEEQQKYLREEREQLAKLIRSYEDLSKEYEYKRKKLQMQARESEFKRASAENRQLTKLIKQLEKEKDLEKARSLQEKSKELRDKSAVKITEMRSELAVHQNTRTLVKGDHVKVFDGETSGQILSIKGKKARVLFGSVEMELALDSLILAKEDIGINRMPGINLKAVAFHSNFSPKIDIRGYKAKEVEDTVDEFIDKALLNNARTLEIVHGKGSGALKKLVWKRLKSYPQIESIWHPDDEQGGTGITMIRI